MLDRSRRARIHRVLTRVSKSEDRLWSHFQAADGTYVAAWLKPHICHIIQYRKILWLQRYRLRGRLFTMNKFYEWEDAFIIDILEENHD